LLAQRLARRGVTISAGALALSLADASACVPPSLTRTTTKAALLVAAGRTAALSVSLSEILKGTTQAMFSAKLKASLTAVLAIVLGAGSVVYCARGQTGPAAKPQNELEALRHENELLNINLRVTLEKIKALEIELGKLKGQAKAGTGVGAAFMDLDKDGVVDIAATNASFKQTGDGTSIEISAARKSALADMESALKLLRAASDAESRRRAVARMDEVMKKLREEVRPRADRQK